MLLASPGGAQLIGLSDRGKLSGIKLPVGEQEVGFYQLPATQVGRSVKDLLSAIGDICERYTRICYSCLTDYVVFLDVFFSFYANTVNLKVIWGENKQEYIHMY